MTPFYDIEKTQTGLSSRMKDAVDFLKCLHAVLSVGDHKELGPHRTDSVGDCREYACPGDQRCKTKVSHILAKTFHRSDSLPVLCLEIPAEHLVPYPLRVLSGESCYALSQLAVQLWEEQGSQCNSAAFRSISVVSSGSVIIRSCPVSMTMAFSASCVVTMRI